MGKSRPSSWLLGNYRTVQDTGDLEEPNPSTQEWTRLCLPETMNSFFFDRCTQRTLPQLTSFSTYLHQPFLCIWKVKFQGFCWHLLYSSFSLLVFLLMTAYMGWEPVWERNSSVAWNPFGERWAQHSWTLWSRAIKTTSGLGCLVPAVKLRANPDI